MASTWTDSVQPTSRSPFKENNLLHSPDCIHSQYTFGMGNGITQCLYCKRYFNKSGKEITAAKALTLAKTED